MKKRHILAFSLPVLAAATLLILAAILAAVILLKPFEKPPNVVYGGAFDPRTCIGEGCHYASSDRYGGVYCDGYSCDLDNLTLICYNTLDEYCRGCEPTENPKACVCTYNNVSARYCSLNNNCYGSQAELELLCVTDQTTACSESERNITNDRPSDIGCGAAIRTVRGLKEEDCDKTWREIYPTANSSIQSRILEITGFGRLCTSFCSVCNSTLCSPGQLCEHARPT